MTLTTARLRLSALTPEDADDLYRIYGDPQTHTFNPAGPWPSLAFAQQKLHAWIEEYQQHGYGHWSIAWRDAPARIIGFAGISPRELEGIPVLNLGYRLAPEAWGKGVASEFCDFALRHAFTTCDLQEITAVVRPLHYASRRVLEKSSLIKTGTVNDIADAEPSLVYRLTQQQWNKR